MDGQRHELLDIVENRRLPYLERYFSRFSLATRKAVEFIVIDRYAPYVSLVKKLFPMLSQKEETKLNDEKRVWRASFKDYLTESEIVDRLLATCPNLRQGYQLYQDVLYAVKKKDHSLFEDCLSREVSQLPETYATTLRTFKKFLPQIRNALRYSYSNGSLECLNNHIKVLKCNAYGFRNFYHFKRRIMIRHGKTILTK